MQEIYLYLTLSGLLTILLWLPYIAARPFIWGFGTFFNNYPEDYPAVEPKQPLWVERSKSAHLNMVETMPAFIAVVLGASYLVNSDANSIATIASWSALFFYTRIVYSIVYTLGIPYIRTPFYLVSWFAILAIAASALL